MAACWRVSRQVLSRMSAAWSSVLALLQEWPAAHKALNAVADKLESGKSRAKGVPLKKTKLLAPVLYPNNIYCAGANYTDHMMEMAKLQGIPPAPDRHGKGAHLFDRRNSDGAKRLH